MRVSALMIGGPAAMLLSVALWGGWWQGNPAGSPEQPKGLAPRASAADYQAQGKAGAVTIAAEFTGHALPTREGPLDTEEYVGVETALYGSDGARLQITATDFTLRVNGKKQALASQPFGLLTASLKDPEWVSPDAVSAPKSKSSIGGSGGGGGGGQADSGPPPPVKIPFAVQRAWGQRLQKAALPEGDRTLPQAGLLFFAYRGKIKSLQSLELVYGGPAGTTTLKLQP